MLSYAVFSSELDKAYRRNECAAVAPSVPFSSSLRKKTVSFSSTTTSSSYKTAPEYDTDSSKGDTDYYSPDEEDDEFFDVSPVDRLVSSVPALYLVNV